MTKITNELIEDYAMLYPRIECVSVRFNNYLITPNLYHWAVHPDSQCQIEYIQLRSIESITDEEAVKIAKIIGFQNYPIGCEHNPVMAGKTIAYWFTESAGDYENFISALKWIQIIEFFKSIRVAVPTIDKDRNIITVDELVESGKLKLI